MMVVTPISTPKGDVSMNFTPIDLANWPRREVFYYFSRMAPTGYSLTTELDVTALRRTLKQAGLKFFPGTAHSFSPCQSPATTPPRTDTTFTAFWRVSRRIWTVFPSSCKQKTAAAH